jgi:hypothetical protein
MLHLLVVGGWRNASLEVRGNKHILQLEVRGALRLRLEAKKIQNAGGSLRSRLEAKKYKTLEVRFALG